MGVDMVIKIAAVGLIVGILHLLLVRAEKPELAMLTTIAGIIIVALMVIDLVADLFETVKRVFGLF